jgi:hypothetical protein
MLARPVHAFATVALVTLTLLFALSARASADDVPGDPVVGNWSVTYGNTTTVAISLSDGVYTETATEPLQVTRSSCYLPPGTVIATFSASGNGYSGQHGLWWTSDCSFAQWAPLDLKLLDATRLSGRLGPLDDDGTCKAANGCETVIFTRVVPNPPAATPPPLAPQPPPTAVQPAKVVLAEALSGLPSTRSCVSRRSFRIRLRNPAKSPISAAVVSVNNKHVTTRRGKRITAPVDLRGLPRGTFTVKIGLILRDARTITGKRVYHTCTARRRGPGSKPRV